jgi:hypothetical protein
MKDYVTNEYVKVSFRSTIEDTSTQYVMLGITTDSHNTNKWFQVLPSLAMNLNSKYNSCYLTKYDVTNI